MVDYKKFHQQDIINYNPEEVRFNIDETVFHHSQIKTAADRYRHNKRTRKKRWEDERTYQDMMTEDRWR